MVVACVSNLTVIHHLPPGYNRCSACSSGRNRPPNNHAITRRCCRGPSSSSPSFEKPILTNHRLVFNVLQELLEVLPSLIMDPFGSHVVRTLLSTLSPDASSSPDIHHDASSRSKKSAAFKAKQGSMSSVLTSSSLPSSSSSHSPEVLVALARRMVQEVRSRLSDNEIRALASDKVASPALQIMLRIESEGGESGVPGSMMDRVLMGLITQLG